MSKDRSPLSAFSFEQWLEVREQAYALRDSTLWKAARWVLERKKEDVEVLLHESDRNVELYRAQGASKAYTDATLVLEELLRISGAVRKGKRNGETAED